MPELPRLSGWEAVRVFQHLGFALVRQKGSHMILRRGARGCVIPAHSELAIGTLRSAIRQAGLSTDDFARAHQES